MRQDAPAEAHRRRALRLAFRYAVGTPAHGAAVEADHIPPQPENVLAAAAGVAADQTEPLQMPVPAACPQQARDLRSCQPPRGHRRAGVGEGDRGRDEKAFKESSHFGGVTLPFGSMVTVSLL